MVAIKKEKIYMKAPGKPTEKLKYLKSLNENDFPYLVADILALCFNHSEIKVTDGTGDGKRDIYSITQNGEKHITQCKFHYDFTKTCTSSETGELINGLLKFGYKYGFFATTGKLSPQAKREYLDNYPGYCLDWIDGIGVVDKVLENNLLYKIWFEDGLIDKSLRRVILPFTIRQYPDNTNFNLKESLEIHSTLTLKNNFFNQRQFFPYNHNDTKTGFSSLSNNVIGYQVEINNFFSYSQIQKSKKAILDFIQSQIYTGILFVRFGIPFMHNILESDNENQINLPISAETSVIQPESIIEEKEWLITLSEEWILPPNCKASSFDWFSFYNKKLDISLQICYETKILEEQNAMINIRMGFEKLVWKKSLFFFGFKENIESFYKDVNYIPDQKYPTEPDAFVLAWFHPRPLFYSADLKIADESLIDEEFEGMKMELIEQAKKFELKQVSFEYAQKIAEISYPQLFNSNLVLLRPIDILRDYEGILSPIDPTKRIFIFERVYKLNLKNLEGLDEGLDVVFNKFEALNDNSVKLYISYSDWEKEVLFFHIKHSAEYQNWSHLSSVCVVNTLKPTEIDFLYNLEMIIRETFPSITASTKHFYENEIGLDYSFEN